MWFHIGVVVSKELPQSCVGVKENFFQEKKDEKNKKETVFMLPRKKIEEELRIFNTVCSVKY